MYLIYDVTEGESKGVKEKECVHVYTHTRACVCVNQSDRCEQESIVCKVIRVVKFLKDNKRIFPVTRSVKSETCRGNTLPCSLCLMLHSVSCNFLPSEPYQLHNFRGSSQCKVK